MVDYAGSDDLGPPPPNRPIEWDALLWLGLFIVVAGWFYAHVIRG